jgi:hypothetical protein
MYLPFAALREIEIKNVTQAKNEEISGTRPIFGYPKKKSL